MAHPKASGEQSPPSPAKISRVPHPNVARFDVRVGVLTFSCLHVARGINRDIQKQKSPPLPTDGKGGAPSRAMTVNGRMMLTGTRHRKRGGLR